MCSFPIPEQSGKRKRSYYGSEHNSLLQTSTVHNKPPYPYADAETSKIALETPAMLRVPHTNHRTPRESIGSKTCVNFPLEPLALLPAVARYSFPLFT